MKAIHEKLALKIVVIVTYSAGEITNASDEAQIWIENEKLNKKIKILGAYLPLYYNKEGVGLFITGMGTANAAASVMALGLSEVLDLSETFFLIAGVGGISPKRGTVGTAVWVNYVVSDNCREVDSDKTSSNQGFYKFQLEWRTSTEVYEMDSKFLKWCYKLTKNYPLKESGKFNSYIGKYESNFAARASAKVVIGDNLSCDSYWHGSKLCCWAETWVKKWTDNKGKYFISDMEDTGIITSLKRLSVVNKLSFERIAILRTASNFVYPPKGISPIESVCLKEGYSIAVSNVYNLGHVVVSKILSDWEKICKGI